ncbi:MAG: AAC(3) family N-acetyltransferase [Candidatus Zixiibacteriota bacterium]|nr:MAG: AAC(3) family N-acetyltransferase [candidate division Zixibacteria bacterium]
MKIRHRIKNIYYKFNRIITDLFFSYDKNQFKDALLKLSVRKGDTIFLHSSFSFFNGFRGNPQDIINCLIEIIGEEGNLLMVSMSYTSSAYDYLKRNPIFDVRRTPSKMGIISEIFRRKKGVLRSASATHPVLVFGKDAEWFVKDHERCLIPCGKDTPFEKFRIKNGKILHFNVPFHNGFTFIHYLEDLIKDELSFPLYDKEPIPVRILDHTGKEIEIKICVFSERTVRTRRVKVLGDYFNKHKILKYRRIGKTKLMLVSAEDAVYYCKKMVDDKRLFFANGGKKVSFNKTT